MATSGQYIIHPIRLLLPLIGPVPIEKSAPDAKLVENADDADAAETTVVSLIKSDIAL